MGLAWEEENYGCDGRFLKFGWLNEKVGLLQHPNTNNVYGLQYVKLLKIIFDRSFAYFFLQVLILQKFCKLPGRCAISAKQERLRSCMESRQAQLIYTVLYYNMPCWVSTNVRER